MISKTDIKCLDVISIFLRLIKFLQTQFLQFQVVVKEI